MTEKECTKCKTTKPLEAFTNSKASKDGLASACRACFKKIRGALPKEYKVWSSLRDRCNNPNTPNYFRYGGRGITVCERWSTFKNFINDMGFRPTPLHQIDRRDNDGNYDPENCHWVSAAENARNRSGTKLCDFSVALIRALFRETPLQGRDLAEMFGVSRSHIYAIVQRRHWADTKLKRRNKKHDK